VTTPRWQERIGGRWAVSWQAYGIGVALNAPLLVLTGGSIGAEPVAAADLPRWLLIAAAASAATALWVLLGDRVFFPRRRQRPAPVAAVVAYHAVTGLIFASSIWFLGPVLGVGRAGTFAETAVTTMAIGLWFGLTMILLLDAREGFRNRREELLDEAVAVEMGRLRETEVTEQLRTTIRERVDAATEDLRAEVSATLGQWQPGTSLVVPKARLNEIADHVRDSAESSVRPLSHELWRLASLEYPRPHWTDVVRQALLSERFWIGPTLLIVFIGYLRAGTYAVGILPGLAAVGLLVMSVAAVLVAANAMIARRPGWRVPVVIVAFAAVQALGVLYTLALARVSATQEPGVEIVGSLIGMTISLLAPANIASLNTAREQVLARLRASTDGARAEQIAQARQLAQITQEAARAIHGSLQTKLIAAAAGIDQAVASGREDLLGEAMQQVSVLLDQPTADLEDRSERSLAETVGHTCAAWQGILDIAVEIDASVADDRGPAAEPVGLIVEEALANAFRHGRASRASIRVSAVSGPDGSPLVEAAIVDDGLGGDLTEPGLGTALIARLADGRVVFEMTEQGFRVTALVSR
jgi:signal transduction histidine kinase